MNTDGNLDALRRHLHEQEDHDARICPQCDGDGVCAYEEPVIDYHHGGFLDEVIDTCDMCNGSGEIEHEEEEE